MKKVMYLFVFMFTISVALIGCQSDSQETGGKDPDQQNNQNEKNENNQGENEPVNEEVTDEPVEVTWFIDQDYYHKNWDAVNNELDKLITNETGLTFKITSGNAEKLSAMIATQDLPDIITVDKSEPQRKLLEDSGLMAPLDVLIEEHAPTYEVPQSMQDWYRNEDGHFYGFVNYFTAPEALQEGDSMDTHMAMYARGDLMKELGIEKSDFDTKEGTKAALKKVKEANIEYNGFKVTPAYFTVNDISAFFGSGKMEDEEGNLLPRPEAELEAIKFLNELYQEGLLPEDAATLTEDQVGEKIAAGSVFAFTGHRLLSKIAALYQNDNEALVDYVGPIKGDNFGGEFHLPAHSMAGWTMTMITDSAEHKDKIIQFFEFMSSDEMSVNAEFGPRGVTWDYDADGKVEIFPEVQKELDEDWEKAQLKYGNGSFDWFTTWHPIARVMPNPSNPFDEVRLEGPNYFNSLTYDSLAMEGTLVEGGIPESGIEVKINEYVEQMHAKMMIATSEAEIDQLYEEMIENEKKLGLDQLMEYKNKKFLEAKERLGIEFVWPEFQK